MLFFLYSMMWSWAATYPYTRTMTNARRDALQRQKGSCTFHLVCRSPSTVATHDLFPVATPLVPLPTSPRPLRPYGQHTDPRCRWSSKLIPVVSATAIIHSCHGSPHFSSVCMSATYLTPTTPRYGALLRRQSVTLAYFHYPTTFD